jgi:hypothetical protein
VTGFMLVNTGAVLQSAVVLGPYRSNVIMPVGMSLPVKVAVSVTGSPGGTPGWGLW